MITTDKIEVRRNIRALGLCSGGLDSILSALVLQRQGTEVEWITFETPFFSAEKAQKASQITGIPLTVKNITPIYLEMLKNPPCGYGQNMNPCMDCHALMFRCASKVMKEKGFDFLFSGEVLGQRPMSQTKSSLRYVEKRSDADGYIVRPLSAKQLPETLPGKNGWISQDALLDLSGRSRKPQIALAADFGITEYPAPAGGCLLTDKGYSVRLRDLFAHQNDYIEREFHLLKYGRHFRLNPDTKIIVGRTREENEHLLEYADLKTDIMVKVRNIPGPLTLIPLGSQKSTRDMILLAASVCIAYSKAPDTEISEVMISTVSGKESVQVRGIEKAEIQKYLI